MKFYKRYLMFLLCSLVFTFGIAENKYPIIPYPTSLEPAEGFFRFNKDTRIYFEKDLSNDYRDSFRLLTHLLGQSGNLFLTETNLDRQQNIVRCKRNISLGAEEYYLNIDKNQIEIEFSTPTGLFYALQTIRQLLPVELESDEQQKSIDWIVPNCTIKDSPAFTYRGFHLDVCRHFSSLDEVKKHINQMALLKLNTFHWHLTDDQGWRIEIKKYPRLTSVGSKRYRTLIGHHNDRPERWSNKVESGFYTQDEVRELVAYAKERHITVIPEIEMPGHATAALASYPEYSCSGGPFDVIGKWGVFNDVFCTKEETFTFLQEVLNEVLPLFPSEYIHIGGDECPKVRWRNCQACQQRLQDENLKDEDELQSYFVKRMNDYIQSKGKQIIGWDEILDGGLASGATVMSWRGTAGGVSAAKQGSDVIMTPAYNMYLDFYQSKCTNEPLANGGYNTIETVYYFNPISSELTQEEAKHIIGVQANVWTEYMPTEAHREYMIYPRMAALAEVAWLKQEQKDYRRFSYHVHSLLKRYDYMNIGYAKSFFGVSYVLHPDKKNGLMLELYANNVPYCEIRYTLDGTEPNLTSPVLKERIPVSQEEKLVKAIVTKDGKIVSDTFSQKFIVNKAGGKMVSFVNPDGNRVVQNGGDNINDCILGEFPLGRFDWYSYAGGDPCLELDFDTPTEITSISLSAAFQPQVHVYPPRKISYEVSVNGKSWQSIGSTETNDELLQEERNLSLLEFDKIKVKKIRLKLELYKTVPLHYKDAGKPLPGLFFDELIVK